jgi:hypothetical protein
MRIGISAEQEHWGLTKNVVQSNSVCTSPRTSWISRFTPSMNWVEDAYYLRLPSGPPSQGDIWSNLPAPYGHLPICTGLVITPRCDLAHDKTPVINYLPIVAIEEFLEFFGGFALLEGESYRAREALKKAAEPLGLTQLVDLDYPIESILRDFEANLERKAAELGISNKRASEYLAIFHSCGVRINEIATCLSKTHLTSSEISAFVAPKAAAKYKLEMARNTVADLHFLPPCPSLLERASVVMMRHITTCTIEFLQSAKDCVSQKDWERLRQTNLSADFASASLKPERLLRLKSPYLESLMARFGTLFARVGVRDIEGDRLQEMIK